MVASTGDYPVLSTISIGTLILVEMDASLLSALTSVVTFTPVGFCRYETRGRQEILCETPNTGFGDALIFNLDPNLEHRITPVRASAEDGNGGLVQIQA